MTSPFSLSLVFPAYNEQDNLDRLVGEADRVGREQAADYEIVVVDDGSVDGTPVVLQRLAAEFPRLKVLTHAPNRGYTAALRSGFASAAKDLVFYSDADNQFVLDELALLLPLAAGHDIVVGYRRHRRDPWIRLLAAWGYNLLARRLFNTRVRDVDCAFKLFHRRVFDLIRIESGNFLVDTEIMAKAAILGLRVAEVGVTHLPRVAGRTSVTPGAVLTTLRGMARLKRILRRFPEGA